MKLSFQKAKLTITYFSAWTLILNLFTICAYSQDDDDRTFFGGLTAGGNFTQVDGDNFAGYNKVGVNAGVVVFARLGEQVAAGMELLYAQKGSRSNKAKLANDRSTVLVDYRIRLNYAEVPLTINYFDKKKNHIGGGLAYGQLFRSRETYKDGNGAVYEQDAKLFPFRKFDLSLVLQGTAHVWKGFYLNLRFQYSLLSVRNAHNYLTGRAEQFNNLWCTRIMYIF